MAVIGPRGSGKSALGEMLATAVGAAESSDDSFTTKAASHPSPITGSKVTVGWADGSLRTAEIGVATDDLGLVKYLPQKAVEQLCAPENNHLLLAQIESVIYQSLPDADRLGASDFSELKSNILLGYDIEKDSVIGQVATLSREHYELSKALESRTSKQRDLTAKQGELTKLVNDLPQLPPEDKKAQDELAEQIARKKTVESSIVSLRQTQERLNELQRKIKLLQASFSSSMSDILASARVLGVSDLGPFNVTLNTAAMDAAVASRRSELQASIDALKAGPADQVCAVLKVALNSGHKSLGELTKEIEARSTATKAYETQKLRYQQQKTRIAQATSAIEALTRELATIDQHSKPRREAVRAERLERYSHYFAVLAAEQAELRKLYLPLQETLSKGSDTDRRLRFEAALTYDLDSHLDQGLAILDRTRRGNFRDADQLRSALATMWDGFAKSGFSPQGIQSGLISLWRRFNQIDASTETITIDSQLRDGESQLDFYNWLLDLRHFGVTSALMFDDTELRLLSPGKKGIVLLMLYLALDRWDTRPLIIDQPEDNLDNLSVYRDLIHLFRTRKLYRQIVLITHNPNLVVNTDAEQVIVASYDGKAVPRITYTSGSLENQAALIPNAPVESLDDGIIEKVCDVLEGGPSAFRSRSNVYALSPKIK